ncbi:MAG: hypothetical protein ABSE64_07955 [Vulcanimicrobiaceae bacterium]|jgi:hypothetical protein
MRRFALLPLVVALLVSGVLTTSGAAAPPPVSAAALRFFVTETAAHAHCPKDEVVWLNTASGIYHEKGMRWYGRTKHGAYVCRKEANVAGDRDTRNGQ